MGSLITLKRGTTDQCDAITPAEGEPLWDVTLDQLRIGDNATAGGIKVARESADRTMLYNAFQYADTATDWHPHLGYAHLHQSMSAKKIWIPLTGLKLGDIIKSYKVLGDAVEAAALTLDCKLVRVNKADPLTTTDIGNGAIAQVTADGNFDVEAAVDDETVATDKQYVLELVGTTGAGDEIFVMGAEVVVTRLG